MKRASLLVLLGLTACPGLDWEVAVKQYRVRNAAPDAAVVFPNGHACGANSDCESVQCRNGVCIVEAPAGNGPIQCGDVDDCGNEPRDGGRVCEPEGTTAGSLYKCIGYTACGKTGRVCRDNDDCFTTVGSCGSGCDRGICKDLSCRRQGVSCTVQGDCCTGFLCTGPVVGGVILAGQGTCRLSASNTLGADELCTSADQCQSKFCSGGVPPTCTSPATGKLGDPCPCSGALTCDSTNHCAIATARSCVLDSSCLTGQCLAGVCSSVFDMSNRVCRQLGLLCGDDNDCCTGLCDAVQKQCTLTPVLLDSTTCTVDPITQGCVADGATLCIGPHGTCTGEVPCCNAMTCKNGSCF